MQKLQAEKKGKILPQWTAALSEHGTSAPQNVQMGGSIFGTLDQNMYIVQYHTVMKIFKNMFLSCSLPLGIFFLTLNHLLKEFEKNKNNLILFLYLWFLKFFNVFYFADE